MRSALLFSRFFLKLVFVWPFKLIWWCIRKIFVRDRVDDYYDDYEEEHYDKYHGSYAQDEEGWSDEMIDDVLDGDPDAYWNID